MKQRWTSLPVWLAFWAVTILLDVGGDLSRAAVAGAAPLDPGALLTEWFTFWGIWILMSPLAGFLVVRLHPDRLGWASAVAAQAVAAAAVGTLQLMLAAVAFAHLEPGLPAEVRYGSFFVALLPRNVMIYGALAGALLAWGFAMRARERELDIARVRARNAELELEARRSELDRLRRDLHPHFLFNALNSVAGMIRSGESARAVEFVARIGTLLRAGIAEAPSHLIPLREELDYVEDYLEVEETRLGDRMAVEWDVDPDVLDARIPRFLLQPVVENAVVHGIGGATTAGARIRVRALGRQDRLCVAVEDTGPGPGDGTEGAGLRATRRRLELVYGADWAMDIAEAPGGGTRAHLDLPLTVEGLV